MAVSQNGWPASPNPNDIDIVPLTVGGVNFSPGIRGGAVYKVLHYVATQVHNRVQKANPQMGCWGYSYRANVNDPGVLSNHASGTAIDFNASLHPNAQDTLASWSQAQVDEIHKILDEVNNVVRWGGDYQYTVDSMHFEINVSPDELDASVPNLNLVDSLVGQPGTPSPGYPGGVPYNEAPVLTEMSVGYPTMNSYAYPANWQFTATQSAEISIDALLSHFADPTIDAQVQGGPDVSINLYELVFDPVGGDWTVSYLSSSGGYQGGDDPLYPDYRNQGRIRYTVEAGKTYIIQAYADNQDYPWVRMVVRIGDYIFPTDWFQPDDLEYIVSDPSYPTGNYLPTTSQLGMSTTFAPTSYDNSGPADGPVALHSIGFAGGLTLSHAFAGAYPGEDPNAWPCAWNYARRLADGGFYWSINNGGSWNGTDPYDSSKPGYGTCPTLANQEWNSTSNTRAVGYHYYSEDPSGFLGGGYSDMNFNVYCTSVLFFPQRFTPAMRRHGLGYAGWSSWSGYYDFNDTLYDPASLPYFTDPDLEGGRVEWEGDGSELIDVKIAFDERNGGGPYQAGVIAKWYVEVAKAQDDPDMVMQWGPRGNGQWIGTLAGPESWVGTQVHLGDYAGGLSNWQYLEPRFWASDYWDEFTNGVRFSAIPDQIFSTAPPGVLGDLNGVGINKYAYRDAQFIAFKMTIRPSRYRVYPKARIPDITWAGQSAIAMDAEDNGRVLY